MPYRWQQAYTELTEFITGHPEIEIGVSVISLPESVRPGFYRLFDAVRLAFLEEKFPAEIDEARSLSRSYLKVEQEVIKLLGVVAVTLPDKLDGFLHDPANELISSLTFLLFDLLKGKSNFEAFEQSATGIVESSFRDLHHSGYVKWLGLSLVRLLEADKAFEVASSAGRGDEVNGGMSYSQAKVALSEESMHLRFSFGQESSFQLVVPEFIVHSAKIDRYVAVTSALVKGHWSASNTTEKREWYPIDSIRARYGPAPLKPDLLIYIGESPKDIALVADTDKICRPDLIIECREQKGWYEKEGLTKVKRHHAALKPKLGTFIVSQKPVPEQAYKELLSGEAAKKGIPEQPSQDSVQEPASQLPEQVDGKQGKEAIHIITAGLDQPNLEPIVEALMNSKVETLLKTIN